MTTLRCFFVHLSAMCLCPSVLRVSLSVCVRVSLSAYLHVSLFVCLFVGARCKFPSDWKGRYFQSGLGNVIIRDGLITTKGTCIDQHRDYFLFANR